MWKKIQRMRYSSYSSYLSSFSCEIIFLSKLQKVIPERYSICPASRPRWGPHSESAAFFFLRMLSWSQKSKTAGETSQIFVLPGILSWYFVALLWLEKRESIMHHLGRIYHITNEPSPFPSSTGRQRRTAQSVDFLLTLKVNSLVTSSFAPVCWSSELRWQVQVPASLSLTPCMMRPQWCLMWLSTEVCGGGEYWYNWENSHLIT